MPVANLKKTKREKYAQHKLIKPLALRFIKFLQLSKRNLQP
jgi:hypothetical protein